MNDQHNALRDLIAPVALGAADPEEERLLLDHAAECSECRTRLDEMRGATDLLAMDVLQVDAPPRVKNAVMAAVRADAADRERVAKREPSTPRATPWRKPWRRWSPALAGATIVGVLVITLLTLWGRGGAETRVVPLRGTAEASRVTGSLSIASDGDRGEVVVSNLPRLTGADAYHLWVIRGGVPRWAGVFDATPGRPARAVVEGLSGSEGVALTAQPRGHHSSPEGPLLVKARLT